MSLGRSRNGVILKSPQEIEEMAEAGRLSAKVLREVGARVQPGVSTEELDHLAEMLIRMEGGIPAFKGYGGSGVYLRFHKRADCSWYSVKKCHLARRRYSVC